MRALAFGLAIFACGCGSDVEDGSGGSSTTGPTGSTGQGGQGGAGGASTGTGAGGGACVPECMSFECCGGGCANTFNDILNCGSCGNTCTGMPPYCDQGTCGTPPCAPNVDCAPDATCCDMACCAPGQLCCSIPGPVGDMIQCTDPTPEGTCPMGCLDCVCASPDTPIATPAGEMRIADLRVGDLVYGGDGDAIVVVPIAAIGHARAVDHFVVHLELDGGAVLEMSPGHPTADGRTFAELRAGDRLDGVLVTRAATVPYTHGFTHDVLPASESGTYVASGVLVGSTMRRSRDR